MPYPGGFEDREDEDDFNEEEEDDGHGGYIRSANDHVILLVDARKNMMEQMDQNANDDSGVSITQIFSVKGSMVHELYNHVLINHLPVTTGTG